MPHHNYGKQLSGNTEDQSRIEERPATLVGHSQEGPGKNFKFTR